MRTPETRYARTADGAFIAYQVFGEGAVDLLYLSPWLSHVEVMWEWPQAAHLLRGLASFSRTIIMDPRGIGLSDRRNATSDLDARADDVRAVLDAVGSDRTVLFGAGVDGGALTAFYAATHPERVLALVLWNSGARAMAAPDYPWGDTAESAADFERLIAETWGIDERTPEMMRAAGVAGGAEDPAAVRWFSKLHRFSVSPGDAIAFDAMYNDIDYRRILPSIQVPTAVMYRRGYNEGPATDLAEHIPGATLVQLAASDDHPPYLGDTDETLDAIERFVRSVRTEQEEYDRVLTTVLFTDIVDSTKHATELGDGAWRSVLERHHATVRTLLGRFRGREIDTAGDGFFAHFDGPARGIKCALAIEDSVRALGLRVRAGMHTGECELIDGKPGGLSVVAGARIGALAQGDEVLVSQTVRDLTAGSGLAFDDRGTHALKGLDGDWHLYAVERPAG